MSQSVFANLEPEAFPYRFSGQLTVERIIGGVPNNLKVAEGWLRKKLAASNELYIKQLIFDTAAERGISTEDAARAVQDEQTVNGFKRDERGLYIEGRQLKAALKEAVSVAIAADKIEQRGWGKTKKFLNGYLAEHVFVLERNLYLGVSEPTGVMQGFVHTHRGNSIKYEEYVDDAVIDFTIISDHNFSPAEWATIWLCGERQGIGASRSQSYGQYAVTKWEPIGSSQPKRKKA